MLLGASHATAQAWTIDKNAHLLTAGQFNGLSIVQATDHEDDQLSYVQSIDAVILNPLRRIISSDSYASKGVSPHYHLVWSFDASPWLQLALTPDSLPRTQSHWTGHITRSHSRLSGWKEGNIQYSHNRTHSS